MLQLLSFIFASADLVLEISTDGEVTFATGAAGRLLGRAADKLVGVQWRDLIEPAEVELIEAALQDLGPGERRGPFRVGLASTAGSQPATLSLFQVPQRTDRISVALSVCHPSFAQLPVDATGLASREVFEAAAATLLKDAEHAGLALSIDLLEFQGLAPALAAMTPVAAEATRRKLAAMLRAASYGGMPAAGLGGDRFALVRAGKPNPELMAQRVREVAGAEVKVAGAELPLTTGSAAESLRAIHYALGRCIEAGPDAAAKSFEAALHQTVKESARFKDLVRSGRFELVYQPVVDLKTRAVHHYEALTRFEGGGGPAAMIKLAEDLGLVVEFDLAVVRTVAEALRATSDDIRVAGNISAFSLQHPGFVDAVLEITAGAPELRPRLLLEVTESQKLLDLDAANLLIQRLRQAGHQVCLDDFGAGSASLDYLRRLETDVLKFDGRFVKGVGESPRDATLLRRLADLCRELDVATVAEMIETEEVARVVTDLGVEFGQGWLFGKPGPMPVSPPRPASPQPVAARRKGAVETWS
jgi:EAL domain-containing protein (putative c-di-GMP-specific phosphodiesterase class I)